MPTAKVRATLKRLLSDLESDNGVSVLLTDDAEICELNRDYRGKDYATDVLSFPSGDFPEGEKNLGDLVISLERVKAQAKSYEVTFEEEFNRLLIHGLLHLFGYDHEGVTKSEAARMRRLEKRLLAGLSKKK